MSKIENITAKEILDSKGKPTLEVTVTSTDGAGTFGVPSGVSMGKHETAEMTIDNAIKTIQSEILNTLKGTNVSDQGEIDSFLLENKGRFGGNTVVGVSIACAKAAADSTGVEVFEYLRTLKEIKPSQERPYLFMVLIEGGKHGDSGSPFQEYQIVPMTSDVKRAYEIGKIVQEKVSLILGAESSIGYEGGFVFPIESVKQPFGILSQAIKESEIKEEVILSVDIAASEFFENGQYLVDGKNLTADELADLYEEIIQKYSLKMIEDPFEEEDFESFTKLLNKHPELIVIGDDLTTTNTGRIKKAIDSKSMNTVIIKPNQIGTLTETLNAMKLARDNDIRLVVSHRGGETMDDFIADLAFAYSCFGLKTGAPGRPERDAKYKRLIKIASL